MNSNFFSLAFGVGSQNSKGEWLEVFYPAPILNPGSALLNCIKNTLSDICGNQVIALSGQQIRQLSHQLSAAGESQQASIVNALENSKKPVLLTLLEQDTASTSTPEAYLKLHLISHRLVKPHGTNLEGIFALLPNNAWTNEGAIDLTELTERQFQARLQGKTLSVNAVDKFPKMTDYVVPNGIRIAHTARVRLGAYIGEGTTIMHEGFVNFNAGTAGPAMIEGRISAGVFVESGSDLGGGCSTMGTLSGGGNIIISIGRDCLIGANAGVGIPLGDRCIIEAGLYITAGAKINVLDEQNTIVNTVKVRELAGQNDLLFRRNSLTGTLECKTNKTAIELNEALHNHN